MCSTKCLHEYVFISLFALASPNSLSLLITPQQIEGPAIHTRRLASTLQLLRDVEPEEWTVNQRLIVLNLLVNELLDTAAVRQALDLQVRSAIFEGFVVYMCG